MWPQCLRRPIWAKCTSETIKARIGAFLGLSVFRPFSVDLFRGEWCLAKTGWSAIVTTKLGRSPPSSLFSFAPYSSNLPSIFVCSIFSTSVFFIDFSDKLSFSSVHTLIIPFPTGLNLMKEPTRKDPKEGFCREGPEDSLTGSTSSTMSSQRRWSG